jgi:hypothetical protein
MKKSEKEHEANTYQRQSLATADGNAQVLMTQEEKYRLLKQIFWDYDVSGELLFQILTAQNTHTVLSREKIFLRMLERLGWHSILDIAGIDGVQSLLTTEIIHRIRPAELRERYETIRKILLGETVSFTGWGDEYYQQIKHTLFSDRWYRSQQALL